MLNHLHASELGESWLKVGQAEGIWPVILVWCSQHLEDFEYLIDLRIAHEERPPLDHLCENASGRPQIYTQGVCLLAKQDLGTSIPECDDLVSVSLDW